MKSILIKKGARSYFSEFSFLFHLKNHDSKGVGAYLKFWLKRRVETVKPLMFEADSFCILQLPIPYCVTIKVTITRHIFFNLFQTWDNDT